MIGLIVADKCSESTFHVESGCAFKGNDPYCAPGSIGNNIFRNIWNIPLATDGWFINYRENFFPSVDFDVLLLVCEKSNGKDFIKEIRSKYPNALLVGYVKESHPNITNNIDSFFKMCDKVALPYIEKVINSYSEHLDKKIYPIHYPYNITAIREKFPREKSNRKILIGCNSWQMARGYQSCLDFSKKISKKLGMEIIENTGKYSWQEWLLEISKCEFCINMDKFPKIGQVPIECAIIGTPHVGGIADAASSLWPNTASNNEDYLTSIITKTFQEDVDFAQQKVVERHSYETIRLQIEDLKK